jgi:hypothetical protein
MTLSTALTTKSNTVNAPSPEGDGPQPEVMMVESGAQ